MKNDHKQPVESKVINPPKKSLKNDHKQPVESKIVKSPKKRLKNDHEQPIESTELLITKANRMLYEMASCNLERLSKQLLSLKIDTEEKLVKFVELVHSRAIDESNYSEQYAKLCSKLPITISNDKRVIAFFTLFTEKCKENFIEIGSYDDDLINIEKRLEEIVFCTDEELERLLFSYLEKRITQKRWLGNVKLIGALYRNGLVNTSVIDLCIDKLIANNDEDSFECLCELLRIIGWKYEANAEDKAKFDQQMNTLKQIDCELPKIQQMIQQVLELRESGWRSLQDLNSSTTDEANQQLIENSHLDENDNKLLKEYFVLISKYLTKINSSISRKEAFAKLVKSFGDSNPKKDTSLFVIAAIRLAIELPTLIDQISALISQLVISETINHQQFVKGFVFYL